MEIRSFPVEIYYRIAPCRIVTHTDLKAAICVLLASLVLAAKYELRQI